MYHIFGIAKGSFSDSLEEVIAQAIHPDDRQKVEQANISVIHDKKPVSLEYRVIWPDKTIRVVQQEDGELVLDETGSPSLITGIVQDITERKRAEEALRESEEKHRAVVERANDSIVILQDGIVMFSNPSFSDKIHKNLSGLQIW
jgi:PAS domain-containing protein